MTTTTIETLRIARLAMYQLRQDVGIPDTVEAADADTSVAWTKCKNCFDVAFAEVLDAHDWQWKRNADASAHIYTQPDNWPNDAKNTLVYCLASELAVPIAGRVEDMKNCRAIYNMKLREARVAALQAELEAVSDTLHKPVLRLLLPNFTAQDADLPRSIKTYTDRIDAEKDAARAEVWNAHDWTRAYTTATSAGVNWNAGMSDALTYLLASKLSMPTARKDGETQGFDQLYRDKLAQARVAALQAELDAVSDAVHKPVLSLIMPNFGPSDRDLPRSIKSYTDRIDAQEERARNEVLAAHNWSFARMEWLVMSCRCEPGDGPYRFTTPAPPKCARILECYGHDGRRADWKLVGTMIRSVEPVNCVIYLRNEERTEKWPPMVRSAYISLLAADVAAQITGSSAEADRLRRIYERDLDSAKLADSRSTGSRREPRGGNFYADAMLRGPRHEPPFGRSPIWR